MGGQWKDWKERVKKKGYDVFETDEERLMNRPERVALEQWPVLVAKWGKEDFLKISATNKKNRSKQGLAHRLGKTPMSMFAEERAKAGLPIDRLSLFLASRAGNAGRSSDPATEDMIVPTGSSGYPAQFTSSSDGGNENSAESDQEQLGD